MALPPGVRRLFRHPTSAARSLQDLDAEFAAHIALRIDELRAIEMSETEAEAEALRRFGDSEEYRAYAARRATQRTRRARAVEGVLDWMQDLRVAGRQFRSNTALAVVAVLTLALGIGSNTAIFSVVHRLLIAPLPYADGNRIVKLMLVDGNNAMSAPASTVLSWRDRARSIEMVAAVSVHALFLQNFGEQQDSVPAFITPNFLDLLGLRPALGRSFIPEDAQASAARVAMISYRKWQREFGGSADVIGKTVVAPEIDQTRYTIVGVMPPEVTIPMTSGAGVNDDLRQGVPAIWLPSTLDSIAEGHVFAKLKRGVSSTVASAELESIRASELVPAAGFRPPNQYLARTMRAQDFLDPREAQTVRVLFVAVAVLLLIACANVANLLMSHAFTRRREFAVRAALGAGRLRLVRQVLSESMLLALAGGVAGVGVAWMTLKVILALRPASLDDIGAVQIAQPILLWSAAISLLAGVLLGCVPALFASRRPVGDVLRSETRSASSGTAARQTRSTLIVLEIALSLVLLVGAGLLVRTFAALQATPLNFEPRGLAATEVLMGFPRAWSRDVRRSWRDDLLSRLRAIPGVTDASLGMMPGLGWRAFSLEAESPDGQVASVEEYRTTFINSPTYFRIAGMRLVAGRLPDSIELTMDPLPAIVNRSLARRLWGGEGAALGGRVSEQGGPTARSYTVVGIVEDIQMPGRRSIAGPADLYAPSPLALLSAVLKTTLSEERTRSEIRRVVAEFDASLRGATGFPTGAIASSIVTGERYLRESLAPARFAMALLLAFALIALLVSTVGLYGVIAYSVAQRTREIGVRVALGADRRSVERLVVGAGLRLTALGVAIGLAGALGSTRLLSGMLYGVGPVDPLSFGATALLVVAISLGASYAPARRAVRIDPVAALRAD